MPIHGEVDGKKKYLRQVGAVSQRHQNNGANEADHRHERAKVRAAAEELGMRWERASGQNAQGND
jgi:hypothetical protein